MRIVADLARNKMIQVEKVPPLNDPIPMCGKYVIPVPEGSPVKVGPSSIILPSGSPNSVIKQSYVGLLRQHPQFQNIIFNPLLEDVDIDKIDLQATLNVGVDKFVSRVQVGRGTGGPLPSGQAPTSVALLPQNEGVTPPKPGVIVSDTIDIGPLTNNIGATSFSVYWYIYSFEISQDISSDFGMFAGQNLPSLRLIKETSQEPINLSGYLSIDDGVTFQQVNRLEPLAFCNPGKLLRVGFKNIHPTQKVYIAAYAVMF